MKNKNVKADQKPTQEQIRIGKLQGSHGYKRKLKKSIEQMKAYLFNVHNRKITGQDVKTLKYLLIPIEKERRDTANA